MKVKNKIMIEAYDLFGYTGESIGVNEEKKKIGKLEDRQFSVFTTGKGYQVYFGKELAKEFEPNTRVCLYGSKITRKLFLIVSNDERCAELKFQDNGSVRIYSHAIAKALYCFFGKKPGEPLKPYLSENISYRSEFATYEIIEK